MRNNNNNNKYFRLINNPKNNFEITMLHATVPITSYIVAEGNGTHKRI